MEIKKLFKRKSTMLAFIAMMLSVQSMFGQDALTSLKFTVKNIAISADYKEISYDVFVKDIDAASVCVSPGFTVRLIVPQADLGTNTKTVTVTNGTPELGVGYQTMSVSGTNWLMKFGNTTTALTWASALTISDIGDGTRLGTFHIVNADGTPFANPQPFNLAFSGLTAPLKSSLSLFIPSTTTLAPNSTTAQPATNFIGFGTYSLTAALTPTTASTPTITLSKAYDGATTAAVTPGTLSGVSAGDAANVTLNATATYSDALVGTAKTITVHYTLSGTAANTYSAPADYVVTTGAITKKTLTIAAPTITLSKAYNGTSAAAVTAGALSGVVAAETANVTVSAAAAYATAAAGTGKTITVTYTLGGTAAGNYTAPVSSSVTTGVITALPLTVSAPTITLSKAYDGTATAAVTAGTLSGVLTADAANVTLNAVATYATAAVGSGKTITVTYTLIGSAAGNYTAPVSSSVTTGVITVKALTIAAPAITLSKPYDGAIGAAVTAGALTGVAAADVANVNVTATATYASATLGAGKTITVTYTLSGSAIGNYTAPVSSSVTTGVITTKALTIAAPNITLSKAYNGSTSALVTAGALSGVVAAESANVTVSAAAAYATAAAGTGKTITVTYTLSGSAAGNYTAPASSSVTTGVITALPLTVSDPTITLSKAYDGTATAAVTAGTLSGVLTADAANVTLNAVATYDNATAGTGKTITVTYTLSGSAADGYAAPVSLGVTTGVITALPLTISAPTITLSKVDNGTTDAAVTAGTLSGVLAADAANVSLNTVAAYDNATVGTGKMITVTYTLSGSAASNYIAPVSSSVTTGVITAPGIAGDTNGDGKITSPEIAGDTNGDGTITSPEIVGDTNGDGKITSPEIAGDTNGDGTITSPEMAGDTNGDGTITSPEILGDTNGDGTITSPELAGDTNGDGTITSPEIAGGVTAKALTVSAPTITLSKEYDGTTSAAVTAGPLSGVLAADAANVSVLATAAYATATVGTGKSITVTYTLSGSAASNYIAPVSSSATTGVITALPLTATDPIITLSKVYDGTTTVAVIPGTLSGMLAADATNVSLNAVAVYDNATVGTGKTITVSYTLSGPAAGNYTAPASTSVTTGVVTAVVAENIVLSQLESPSAGCEGSNMELLYNIQKGAPTQYKLAFNDAAHTAGIQDVVYTNLPSLGTTGTISFAIPAAMTEGVYQGTLVVADAFGTESPAYSFSFTVNLSADYVVQMFDDVVTCDNKSNRFVAYQWYKDGVAITDATKQFYCEKTGLNGSYYVKVTTADGKEFYSCPKVLTSISPKTVSAYPNPVKSNQAFTVKADGFENQELEGSILSVYDTFGTLVYQSSKVEKMNMLNLPLAPKVYVGRIKTKNGSGYAFKVIVE